MENTKEEIHLVDRILSNEERKYKKTLKMSLFLLILGVIMFSIGFLTVDQYVPENPVYKFWVIISGIWFCINTIIFVIGLHEKLTFLEYKDILLRGFKSARIHKEFFDKLEKENKK